jgi:hypothetical protein
MAENMLMQAGIRERSLAASQRRYRIGDYEFRQPDHEQIQRWAKMLGMGAKDVVAEFQNVSEWIISATHINFDDQNGLTGNQCDFSFDENMYTKAKPFLIEAAASSEDHAADVRKAMRILIQVVMDQYGADVATKMMLYIVRFISDVHNGTITQEEINSASTDCNLENSSLDPELMQAGLILAVQHIERGARTFDAYAKAMLKDMGEDVKPYLKSWYMGIKHDPRASIFDGMDCASAVESANVDMLEPLVKLFLFKSA